MSKISKKSKEKFHMRYNEFGVEDTQPIISREKGKIIESLDDLPEITKVDKLKINKRSKVEQDVAEKAPIGMNNLPDLDSFLGKKFMKKYFE